MARTVTDQYKAGRPADTALEAGDLVFFSTIAPGPSHIGIALYRDTFIHAPGENGAVRVDRIESAYWHARLVGVRRVL